MPQQQLHARLQEILALGLRAVAPILGRGRPGRQPEAPWRCPAGGLPQSQSEGGFIPAFEPLSCWPMLRSCSAIDPAFDASNAGSFGTGCRAAGSL
jgi:hypothetical protein